jgi:hypothetical protein
VALPPVRVALRAPVPGLPWDRSGPALAPAPTDPRPADRAGTRSRGLGRWWPRCRPSRPRSWVILEFGRPPASSASPQRSPHEEVLLLEDLELALLAHGVGDHLPIELAERVLALRAQRAMLAASLGLDDAL